MLTRLAAAYAEGAADFGCVVGGVGEVMTAIVLLLAEMKSKTESDPFRSASAMA
jgi:hypothetical protein